MILILLKMLFDPINDLKGDDLPVSAFLGQRRRYIPFRNYCIMKNVVLQ